MILELHFKNIIDDPLCKIIIANKELYNGVPPSVFICDINVDGPFLLEICHYGKQPTDTVVENNVIIRDRSFELDKLILDSYNIEELIWDSCFKADDGQVFNSCLFFGPNGKFMLNAESPGLKWILQTRHIKNNNDPNWEEDYTHYVEACKLLQK